MMSGAVHVERPLDGTKSVCRVFDDVFSWDFGQDTPSPWGLSIEAVRFYCVGGVGLFCDALEESLQNDFQVVQVVFFFACVLHVCCSFFYLVSGDVVFVDAFFDVLKVSFVESSDFCDHYVDWM